MFNLSEEDRARIIEEAKDRWLWRHTVTIPRAWLDVLPDALSADGRTEEALQALKMKESGNS